MPQDACDVHGDSVADASLVKKFEGSQWAAGGAPPNL
jgi:hypothetical protein